MRHQPGGALYFCKEDFDAAGREVFPDEVITALVGDPTKGKQVRDIATGEDKTVYPLPEPWDLPVIFSVRLSLSLPALFEAVPMYMLVTKPTVRDDFGRSVQRPVNGTPENIEFPAKAPPGREWAARLWFSDGGITSNFPIHFFDSLLPVWPTFGINLGSHPPGFAHQDVWLPQDWQAGTMMPRPLGGSFLAFVSGIVDTARSWRDTMQTFMPSYRGRVAWVRQAADEGGTNLFMAPAPFRERCDVAAAPVAADAHVAGQPRGSPGTSSGLGQQRRLREPGGRRRCRLRRGAAGQCAVSFRRR